MPTALVTGANRGLGFETCRELAAGDWDVILTARNAADATRAAGEIGSRRVRALALDVTDAESVARAVEEVRAREPLDALVDNAGVSLGGFDGEVARATLEVNFFGAVRVTDAFLPLLTPRANVVLVSSGMGELGPLAGALRQRLLDPGLDRAALRELGDAFVSRVAHGGPGEGFPNNAYSVSKILLNAFARVLARDFGGSGRRANAVCPGWTRTRMGGDAAPRSVERGARGIVWAATLGSDGPNGGFFRDEKRIEW